MRYRRPFYSPAPRSLRRSETSLDNIALVPASELDSLARWANESRQMAPGSVVVVTQADNLRLQAVGHSIGQALRRQGRHAQFFTISR